MKLAWWLIAGALVVAAWGTALRVKEELARWRAK